jgi:beta-glucanase (GH16 family)
MKTSLRSFGIALSAIALAANMSAAPQQLGAEARTKQTFGNGKLVMTLQPSTEKGIINGFFMLKFNGTARWDYGWTEVDFEYVPGNNDAWRPTAEGNCGPNGQPCTTGKLNHQSADDFISVNIIGGDLTQPPARDSQVFYRLGKAFFEAANTYTFAWAPDQVQWSASGNTISLPFMYQNPGNQLSDIHQSRGLNFLVGRQMNIRLNCYSGLGYNGSFGGSGVIPTANTAMVVKMVAFYPLSNGQFSTVPSMSSDFVNGKYTLNNAASTFDAIWDKIFSNDYPVYVRPENVSVQQGTGLVLSYKYIP